MDKAIEFIKEWWIPVASLVAGILVGLWVLNDPDIHNWVNKSIWHMTIGDLLVLGSIFAWVIRD